MIDGKKKLFQNNLLHHFPKVNTLQSWDWEYYAKIASIL